MRTSDPQEAVRNLFNETIPQLPQLSGGEIQKHLRDWAGGDDAQLYSGSRQYVESLVIPHDKEGISCRETEEGKLNER